MYKSLLRAYRKIFLCLVAGLYMSVAITAQQSLIKGKVVDSLGKPIPGVSVVLKGTTLGTITGVDGSYTISGNLPTEGILIYSFIGMKSQEKSISGQSIINVTLNEETLGLDEVVVIGYGTQEKKDITGSVAWWNQRNWHHAPTHS
ncbi:carboxypeptidase-like regulatory domain-containing protein [Saccharicrinis fermentans]|uniref:TonB-linked outer membrane protein, SusC/RagA family n=1 Tax=Saccharicrinis fermentans DSM 9555 = JCM 21142 TaxID=869213 RepID=W7YDP2_9BACT|nr:carboxypeptidase-like regulatory domain-containing protein [Saccharicrinis fermentans]GAF02601.1 TonB-linked outer membrane protein, SusC/RagA family [Saccharicrinis fermentans DSM 9555 = JCM 21142]